MASRSGLEAPFYNQVPDWLIDWEVFHIDWLVNKSISKGCWVWRRASLRLQQSLGEGLRFCVIGSNCKTEKVIPTINYYVLPIRLTTCSVHIHNESTHLSMWCVQCWWIRTAYVSCICFFVALSEQLLKDGWTMLAVARMVRMKMTPAKAHPLDIFSMID